jgi:hypothetical protein
MYRLLHMLVRNHVKKTEIDVDFSTYGRDEKYVWNLTGRNKRERNLGRPMCISEVIIKNGT